MASNNNINVTLGQWEQDIAAAAADASSVFDVSDYTRITTYADLVKKTISLSSEIRHDLNIDDNDSIDNIFVVNGRKTLTYQQLSHSSNVKVYLRESPTAKEKHLYRFNGEDNHLPKFSCDDTYIDSVDGEKEYDYNQCVLVEDVSADMITNMIRFRFDNITFCPEIRFVSCNDDGFAEDASVVNYMDQINPHDVYVNMTDGRKCRFSIGAIDASGLSGKLIYRGSEEYYTGSVNEYQYQYGGDVSVTYSVFNTMSQPVDLVTADSSSIATTIDVEPYHHRAYVNMSGHRNKTSYVYIQTDGHIGVRKVTNAQPDSYDNIDKEGTIIVLPPERAGYCRTDVADPAQLKLSIQSQSVESYNRYTGSVYVYDNDGVEKFNSSINIKYFENENILDLDLLTENHIKPDYSTLLQLETVAPFKKTKVRVTDWYNMAVTYVTDFDPSTGDGGTVHNDVSTIQRGQKYIHTFWTEDQVLTQDYVGIKVAVTKDTVSPEDKTIGYGQDLQIAKISLKSNINSFVRGFNESNFAMIPYKHNKPRLPNVLDLYLRLLPKISVKFYLPTGFLVSLPGKDDYQGDTCVLEYDAEDDNLIGNSLSFDIKRDSEKTSMNMLTGQFYYNETGSGIPADVIF